MLEALINAILPHRAGVLELPEWYGAALFAALAKGAMHKYIKRVPKPGGGYRYYYTVGGGGGVHHADHFVEGASFKHEGGHYHIAKAEGDTVHLRHDESGETKKVSKAELGAMLAKHHEAGLKAHREKAAARAASRVVDHRKSKVNHRPHGDGSRTVVFFSGKDGQPVEHAAKWRVVEADDIHASHLPGSGFKKNPAYPEGVQERVYHSDKAEQEKVLGNAARFRPEIVHNTNPDAVNGAPVVTEDGVVLGGNSRTMTMKHLYETGHGAKVKDHLVAEAHQFGLDKAQIAGMKNPILVREVSGVRADSASKDDLKMLVRQANESFTQGMDPRAEQVAKALKLSDEAVASLATNLGEDETVADFLGKPSGASRQFIEKLRASGVIDRRNESQYLRSNGTLNEDGKAYITKLFVGKMVPDSHLLSEIPASLMQSLAKSAPYVLAAKAQGPKYDVTGDVRSALHAIVDMDIHGSKSLDDHLRQTGLSFGGKPVLGELDVASKPEARRMYEVLTRNKGPNQMAGVFRDFARFAKLHPEGQTDLFGSSTSAHDILHRASLKKGEAVYYGPKGGKYKDPAHKHSWRQDDKGGEQSDWVGDEDEKTRTARNARVKSAVESWMTAALANHKDPSSAKAYQAHERALYELGKALNAGTGKDAIAGAQRWLRSKGYRPDLKQSKVAESSATQLAMV